MSAPIRFRDRNELIDWLDGLTGERETPATLDRLASAWTVAARHYLDDPWSESWDVFLDPSSPMFAELLVECREIGCLLCAR